MKRILLSLVLVVALTRVESQVVNPVRWDSRVEKVADNEYALLFTARIDEGWHLYAQDIPAGGPIPTAFTFLLPDNTRLIGSVAELTEGEVIFDKSFGMDVKMFSKEAVFRQIVKIISGNTAVIDASVEYASCDDRRCLPPEEETFSIRLGEDDIQNLGSVDSSGVDPLKRTVTLPGSSGISSDTVAGTGAVALKDKSLWGLFILAFLLGFAGLLTPCVYPMIPMTVSFFMQGSEQRGRALLRAAVFGLSIVLIYTAVGLVISLTSAGADFANVLSTHWIPNLIFFLFFLVFAASFLGMFEIVLPAGWTNRADRQADKGGLAGAFFMALVTTLVSFSCTGPIVGALLVKAATGDVLEPLVGMFGFGLAFALPFTILAFSPSLLKSLPKSGGWLNEVKVFLGFIILAFSLKFFSNIDQAYHWGILPRDLFLAVWIILFTLLGVYLMGKIRFSHDSDLPFISVPRLALIIIVFSFVVYMIPGLFGAPLKGISGLLPPLGTQQFTLASLPGRNTVQADDTDSGASLCEPPVYADFLQLPYDIPGYFDYEQGIACAQQLNKPVLLDFKGHACSNCKEMEAKVWSDPEVLKRLKNDFVVIALYTDDKTRLPEQEWIISAYDGKEKRTMGKKNADFLISRFNTNTIPLYAVVDHEGKPLTDPVGYEPDAGKFIEFLEAGRRNFHTRDRFTP